MSDLSGIKLDTNTDKDIFQKDVSEVFSTKYVLDKHVSVGLDSTYVLLLDFNSSKDTIAGALSNGKVSLYTSDLIKKESFKVHEDSITGLQFSPTEPNLFYTSSMDMEVKLWDLRTGGSQGQVKRFYDSSAKHPGWCHKPLTSFSVNASDRFLTAGTEQVRGESYLLFWDSRSEELLGGYWNTHIDDITTLKYHISDPNKLASGSVDGVVNVYDISQPTEDEALSEAINTESSVQKIKWYNKESEDSLAIITHTEDIYLWRVSDSYPAQIFKRDQITSLGLRRSSVESAYVVDVHPSLDKSLFFICGSRCPNNSCLRVSYPKKSKLKPYSDLKSSKILNELVRCSIMNENTGDIVTGNESGLIIKWSPAGKGENDHCDNDVVSGKNSRSSKFTRKFKPY
ncbi:WD repeat-containing protein 89 [Lepeophtheirus salmonis]|uniref:WD repeat-containing protein 89 n=1 Tax=Lepeophtheirus salmonis TaxID=72036 RepID=UPI001AEA3F3C|nr:WD repeat-containing protein 89-like [Lepeophtheirus salmonis]